MIFLPSNEKDKDNDRKLQKPPIWFVDQEANRLVEKYQNPQGKLLYCKAFNNIDIFRIQELEKQAESGKQPGHLFSTLLSQELDRCNTDLKNDDIGLDNFKKNYGKF